MSKAKGAVAFVTIYLISYVALFQIGASMELLAYLFLLSPFLLVGMVYCVLTDSSLKYPELLENEEWGYRDKEKDKLELF